MLNESKKKKGTGKDTIGIVYVDGAISLGEEEDSPFSEGGAKAGDIRKALDEAARDESVKAVVLRVDSPGGSAVASEIILNATQRVKAKKPFVVSMGNVAGSGGYYVACAADTIFADEATITGSIGVVSGKLVTNPMWSKIGITFKEYKRGKNAGMLSSAEPFSEDERQRMQAQMDEIYGVFKKHVVDSRGDRVKEKSNKIAQSPERADAALVKLVGSPAQTGAEAIEKLAGGRVYTGKQALELGLVDKIGSLQDAVDYIAKKANISDYSVRVIPTPKNFIEKLVEDSSGGKDDPNELDLRTQRPLVKSSSSLVDLALPYLKGLDPQRTRLVISALERLQLVHREGVILMMPELAIRP